MVRIKLPGKPVATQRPAAHQPPHQASTDTRQPATTAETRASDSPLAAPSPSVHPAGLQAAPASAAPPGKRSALPPSSSSAQVKEPPAAPAAAATKTRSRQMGHSTSTSPNGKVQAKATTDATAAAAGSAPAGAPSRAKQKVAAPTTSGSSSSSFVQTLPQRPNGRCYFVHDRWSKVITERPSEDPARPGLAKVTASYTGEWTLACTKPHVHSKRCPQHATGRGTMRYKMNGREFEEEGHFRRGRLVTGSDSSDSEIDTDESDEPEDEPYIDQPATKGSDHMERKEEAAPDGLVSTTSTGKRTAAGKKRAHAPDAPTSGTDARDGHTKDTHDGAGDTAAAAPKAKKQKTESMKPAAAAAAAASSSDSSDSAAESDDMEDVTPFIEQKQKAVRPAAPPSALSAASACVFYRREPGPTSSKIRPHSISEKAAAAFEAAAEKAAQARATGRRPPPTWSRDGWTYRGHMKQGKRHGFGTTTFDSGSVFKGEYVHDQCTGHGVWTHWEADGTPLTYEGGWLDDMEHGPGVLHSHHPDLGRMVARGRFEHGEMEGPGTWTLESGHVYFKGTFHRGHFARGRLHSLDPPRRYEGEFEFQQFSGRGCLQWPNDTNDGVFVYGDFVRHDPYGVGVLIVPMPPPFEGESAGRSAEPFRIFPALYKSEAMVYARWIEKTDMGKRTGGDEADKQAMDTGEREEARSSSESDADAMLVWMYLRQLIADGLRAATRMQSAPLTESALARAIDAQLAAYSSPGRFRLVSLPNSIFHGEKRGVCAYRISDELGCANQPYECHTCSKGRANTMEVCAVSQRQRETPTSHRRRHASG